MGKDFIDKASYCTFPESLRTGHFFKEHRCILQKCAFCFQILLHFPSGKSRKEFFYRKSISVFYFCHLIQIKIGKTRQYQIVNFIKG